MKKKLLYYLLLISLTIVIPYLTTMILISITGDRYKGMTLAIIPGIVIVHLIFGLIAIKLNWTKKIVWTLVLSTLIFGVVFLMLTIQLIKSNLGLYGFWDITLSNLIAGFVIWESFFLISNKLQRKTS
ncbi:MAG: hypothetical protein V4667_05475 [Bacteroidota bacterium]